MKKLKVITLIFAIVFFILFYYSRNSESAINFERFNLVAPGVLRTPDERFKRFWS